MSLKNSGISGLSFEGRGDRIARDFYIPVLRHSVAYDRATGYFSCFLGSRGTRPRRDIWVRRLYHRASSFSLKSMQWARIYKGRKGAGLKRAQDGVFSPYRPTRRAENNRVGF
jgi:hypothetical protein